MAVFALRGLLRGAIDQVLSLVGLVGGLWLAVRVSQWVGAHWHGARPAAVFGALAWVVGGLAGLAVASIFQWWGAICRKLVQSGPAGWIDRAFGSAVGVALGSAWATVVLTVFLLVPHARPVSDGVARSRLAPGLLGGAARACDAAERVVPDVHWVGRRVHVAERASRLHPRKP